MVACSVSPYGRCGVGSRDIDQWCVYAATRKIFPPGAQHKGGRLS